MEAEWTDAMKIGQPWGDALWGTWEGGLVLSYSYKVTGKEKLKTPLGSIDCFVIESTADSSIGQTRLKSYFSNQYGFVRLEYHLLNNIQVNFWLVETKTNQEFNDTPTFFKTKEYIKQ